VILPGGLSPTTNVAGALVAHLVNGNVEPGLHTATLDASRLASGVYFVKLQSADDNRTTKVIVE